MHQLIKTVILSYQIYEPKKNFFYRWTDNLLNSNIQKWKVKLLQID